MKETVYDYKVKDINGKEVAMSDYKDKVLLIVNVASTCGFTPQYKGLQDLYEKYSNDGFDLVRKKKGAKKISKNSVPKTML